MTVAGRRYRFWFYVNGEKVHDSAMTREELDRACAVGQDMLKPDDLFVMVAQDLDRPTAPWFTGNDRPTAERVIPELFPGMKAPAGELDWQARHGARIPPEAMLDGV